MAITFVGAGAAQQSTAALSPSVPAGLAAHDALILIVISNNQAISTPSGFSEMRTTNTTNVSAQMFIKDATGSETTISVPDSGNWTKAQCLAFRGVDLTGLKFDAGSDFSVAANSTTANVPQTTAGLANEVWVGVAGSNLNLASFNFTSSTLTSNAGIVATDVNGTMSWGYGTLSAAGLTASPIATVTANTTGRIAVAGNLLKPKLAASVGGTMQKATGSIAASPGTGATTHAIAGTLQKATGSVAATQKDTLVVAGTMTKLTASIAVANKEPLTLAGTMMKLTGSVVESQKLGLAVSGSLQQMTSVIASGSDLSATVDGALPTLAGSMVVDLRQGLFIQGALGQLTGQVAASVTLPSGTAVVAGALVAPVGALTLDLGIAPVAGVIVGTMQKLTGALSAGVMSAITLAGALKKPVGGIVAGSLEKPIDIGGILRSPVGAIAASSGGSGTCYDVADDRREQVLARLAVVLGGLGAEFGRNDPDIPETMLPKITMLDSDEDANRDVFDRGRPPNGPNRISLTPEVYITLAGDTPEEVGAAMSAWETTITSAVLNDGILNALAVDGRVEFNGTDSAVESGRNLVGQMSFDFTIWYRLIPEAPCVVPTVDVGSAEGREAIIEALGQIIEQTEGVASWARNDLSAPDDESYYPRVILLDGRESVDPNIYQGRTRPSTTPRRVFMEPELYVLADGDVTTAGPKLNQIRLMLLRGIMNEPVLASLVMDDDIRYEGCQTAMAAGRGMTGEMGMVISLARVMRP